jgi:hypothetical protein
MSEDKVKVLYIGGSGRSGTTLLLRMLGQIEGFLPVGELWHIWYFNFTQNQLCGCEKPFKKCEFWHAVLDEAFGGLRQIDVDEIRALRRSVQTEWYLSLLAVPRLRTSQYQHRLERYTDILSKLYRAIQKVSGCRVIVDSSKGPRYAWCLSETPGIDLRIVHLVRDSRAVAYSWQRKKLKPEVHWKTEYMALQGPIASAMEWTLTNSSLPILKCTGAKYMRVYYEDIARDPRPWLAQIVAHMGDDVANAHVPAGEHNVYLGSDHIVQGNPDRFQRGVVELRPDTEWQNKMASSQKYLVTALTWPLLLKHNYIGRKR